MTNSHPVGCLAAYTLAKEGAFRSNATDSFLKRSGKFAVGTAITTSAFGIALVETALSAIAATLASPAYILAPEKYAKLTSHTAASADTIVQAAKRTFRVKPKQAEEAKGKEETPPAEPVTNKLQLALAFAKKHETALTAGAIAATVVGAYYFGLFDHTGNLFALHSTPLPPEPVQVAVKAAAKAVDTTNSFVLPTCAMPTFTNTSTAITGAAKKVAATTSSFVLPTCAMSTFTNTSATITGAAEQAPAPLVLFADRVNPLFANNPVCYPAPMTPWANATAALPTTPITYTPSVPSSSALTLFSQSPLAASSAATTTAATTLPPLNFASTGLASRFTPQAPAPLVPYTDRVSQLFASNPVCNPTTPWANATSALSTTPLTYIPQAPKSTALTIFTPKAKTWSSSGLAMNSASTAGAAEQVSGSKNLSNFFDSLRPVAAKTLEYTFRGVVFLFKHAFETTLQE